MHNFLYILSLIAFSAAVASAILGMETEAAAGMFIALVVGFLGLVVDKSEDEH